ncbi:MAG: T9SS type A sorting domain-containing protein, partial [Bacteroidetes bacterium]|nr:T9SS type A sorting domain-containing protein [Bacteroidota bacterium]
ISILIGDGTGSFVAPTNFAVTGSPGSVINSDFNGDGNLDLATANQGSNKVSVLFGNGAGSFTSPTNFIVGDYAALIALGDFNIDGKIDLAVVNQNSNNVSVLLGNGAGSFAAATNFPVGSNPHSLTSSDFNGDGKADLAVPDYGDNDVSILINNYIPSGPPICLVTVDSTLTHNLLVWEKTNLNLTTIDSFIVYREITTNNYQRIAAVSKDSLSIFIDLSANPATTGYRYKLKSKNAQGVTTLFSDYHNTIYLTNTGANFSWTPYQIENNNTPVSTYNIYRDDNSTGNFVLIGNTTGSQFGYTDIQYSYFPNSQYYVEAVMAGGVCQPTRSSFAASRSNIKHIGMSGIQQLNNNSAIIIYPNPSTNVLNITGIKEKTTIRLYDVVGKLVMEKESDTGTTLNTSVLTAGIYTLLMENNTYKTFDKVVINR